jgi:hypothetical protein
MPNLPKVGRWTKYHGRGSTWNAPFKFLTLDVTAKTGSVELGDLNAPLTKVTITAADKFTASYSLGVNSGTFSAECVDTAAGKGSLILDLPYEKGGVVRCEFNPAGNAAGRAAPLGATVPPPSLPNPKFDPIVFAHITRALAGAAHNKTQTQRLFYAWQLLKMERETFPSMSTDLPLAAAEHNLFARYAVCSGEHWRSTMWMAAIGYEWNKQFGEKVDSLKDALGITRKMPPGAPPSHSSSDVERWGEMGAFQGEMDRVKEESERGQGK